MSAPRPNYSSVIDSGVLHRPLSIVIQALTEVVMAIVDSDVDVTGSTFEVVGLDYYQYDVAVAGFDSFEEELCHPVVACSGELAGAYASVDDAVRACFDGRVDANLPVIMPMKTQ